MKNYIHIGTATDGTKRVTLNGVTLNFIREVVYRAAPGGKTTIAIMLDVEDANFTLSNESIAPLEVDNTTGGDTDGKA